MSFSAIPNYKTALAGKNIIERTWYQFLSDIWKGRPSGAVSSVSSLTSPLIYQAQSKGFMIVQGGTVTIIQFTRDRSTNYNTGQTSGIFPLAQGDSLIVSYSSVPTMTWVPL